MTDLLSTLSRMLFKSRRGAPKGPLALRLSRLHLPSVPRCCYIALLWLSSLRSTAFHISLLGIS